MSTAALFYQEREIMDRVVYMKVNKSCICGNKDVFDANEGNISMCSFLYKLIIFIDNHIAVNKNQGEYYSRYSRALVSYLPFICSESRTENIVEQSRCIMNTFFINTKQV